jgi:hypothetical protein
LEIDTGTTLAVSYFIKKYVLEKKRKKKCLVILSHGIEQSGTCIIESNNPGWIKSGHKIKLLYFFVTFFNPQKIKKIQSDAFNSEIEGAITSLQISVSPT